MTWNKQTDKFCEYCHLFHMLNKFCHKLIFSAAGWPCNNARERVLESLVHLSLN